MVAVLSTMHPLGWEAAHFTLPEPLSGNIVSLDEYRNKPALLIAFICNHCPYVHHIRDAFGQLVRDYLPKGLGVLAINSNDVDRYPQDAPDRMIEEARNHRFPFRYLFDDMQQVAKLYGAACTPDFFLFDKDLKLAYRGQFDASRPDHPTAPEGPTRGAKATGDDLRSAIDLVLQGHEVPEVDQHPSLGCSIKWRPGNEPDWFLPYMHG